MTHSIKTVPQHTDAYITQVAYPTPKPPRLMIVIHDNIADISAAFTFSILGLWWWKFGKITSTKTIFHFYLVSVLDTVQALPFNSFLTVAYVPQSVILFSGLGVRLRHSAYFRVFRRGLKGSFTPLRFSSQAIS